ncbi:hypothetical protein FOL47_010856 [Perkinsus chesapeaki]|uniref:Uncharacterized protein n=1 Tax=Perkinsus chesapeaki TaxID=330153 RepID=A0A7J6L0S8_PERCH|nr:hypothetical protein FOL47_010856 [Perkinsus chesapeaki]
MVVFLLLLLRVKGHSESEVYSEDDTSTTTRLPLNLFNYDDDRLLYTKSEYEWENYGKQELEMSEKQNEERGHRRGDTSFDEMKVVELLEGLIKHHNEIAEQGHYFTHSDAQRMSRVTERIVEMLSELEELDNGIRNGDILSRLGHLQELHPELVDAALEGTHRDYLHELADRGLFRNADGHYIGEYYGGRDTGKQEMNANDRPDEMVHPEVTTTATTAIQEITKWMGAETVNEGVQIGEVSVEEVSDIHGEVLHHEPEHSNAPYGLAHKVLVPPPTQRNLRETVVEEPDLINRSEPTMKASEIVLLALIGVVVLGYIVQKLKHYHEMRSLHFKHETSSDLLDDL